MSAHCGHLESESDLESVLEDGLEVGLGLEVKSHCGRDLESDPESESKSWDSRSTSRTFIVATSSPGLGLGLGLGVGIVARALVLSDQASEMLAPWLIPRTPTGRVLGLFDPPQREDPPELIYHGHINFEPIGEVLTDVRWKLPKASAERDFWDAVKGAQDALDHPVDFGDLKLRFPNLPNAMKLIYPLPKTTTESTPLLTEENALKVLNYGYVPLAALLLLAAVALIGYWTYRTYRDSKADHERLEDVFRQHKFEIHGAPGTGAPEKLIKQVVGRYKALPV
ncbi:hypothetical protein AAVH_14264 [Aphelenchoides avenae]|nr:hypothetical protein AAVH_14264 [Aphelenchus avenae]